MADPDDNPFDGLTDKHTRTMAARELYDRGVISYDAGLSGIFPRIISTNNTNRLVPDLNQLIGQEFRIHLTAPTQEERQEMAWQNPEAADIAREILQNEMREGLREKVGEAVAHYREMLEGAHCGSVFSFMKENDEGKHYWYAAVKNGDKWYTTAQNPRVINSDDEFITWLIGLGAHESKAAELTVGAAHTALALGPIDSTATDGSET